MKKRVLMLAAAVFMLLCLSMTAMAGQWVQVGADWKYLKDDGSYENSGWQWIDGNQDGIAECYYFKSDGSIVLNGTTPDGYMVDATGAWVENGVVQTRGQSQPAGSQTGGDFLAAYVGTYHYSYSDFTAYPGGKIEYSQGNDDRTFDVTGSNGKYYIASKGKNDSSGPMELELKRCEEYDNLFPNGTCYMTEEEGGTYYFFRGGDEVMVSYLYLTMYLEAYVYKK